MPGGTMHRRMMAGQTFEGLALSLGLQEWWPLSDANITTSAGSIADTYGKSDDTFDNQSQADSGATATDSYVIEQEPVIATNTGTTSCVGVYIGAPVEINLQIGEISASFSAAASANWSSLVFLKVNPIGACGGTHSGPEPATSTTRGIQMNCNGFSYQWQDGVETGVDFSAGVCMWAAANVASGDYIDYLFHPLGVASRNWGGTGIRSGSGQAAERTTLKPNYRADMNGTQRYSTTWFQDYMLFSGTLTQANLQALYDKAMS